MQIGQLELSHLFSLLLPLELFVHRVVRGQLGTTQRTTRRIIQPACQACQVKRMATLWQPYGTRARACRCDKFDKTNGTLVADAIRLVEAMLGQLIFKPLLAHGWRQIVDIVGGRQRAKVHVESGGYARVQ